MYTYRRFLQRTGSGLIPQFSYMYDCLTASARTSLSLIHSQCSRDVSHLCRNWFAIQSYLSRKCVEFQNEYNSISRGQRQVRDGFDFATILRGILSHTIFEYVQHFATFLCQFATYARKLRITPVAKQSQSSEIGAYYHHFTKDCVFSLSPRSGPHFFPNW